MDTNEMKTNLSKQVSENEIAKSNNVEMHMGTPAVGGVDISLSASALGTTSESKENLQDGVGDTSGVTDQFVGLPIESLICGPIIAAAKGQQELTAVYVDTVMKLAYKDGTGESGEKETNTLDFTLNRPVVKEDGSVGTQECEISAPLISLVPVPAFTMDELTVDFDMEVKSSDLKTDSTQEDIKSTISYKSWFGLSANITGSVTSDSSHKRETDSTATYKIHARAVQQPPSEGMAKLTSLFSQAMEPIPKNTSGQ